jgi:NADPH:quinone reductase
MRSLRYHAFGKPQDVLQVDELPSPEPGPGQVRVRMTHRSLNPADLNTVTGRYGNLPELPAVGGHEGVGVVATTGEGVEGLAPGQRVVPMGVEGTWQEEVVVDAEVCFPVPDGVPDEAAAQLFVNPLTAQLMLDQLALPEGAWLLQTAGTSQVGRLVVQLAARRGLRTISLVRRPDGREELEALGADAVLVATTETDAEDVRSRVMDLTDGRGADGALDAVLGEVGSLAARCLADQADMLVYGGLSGKPLQLDAATLIYRRSAVRGFWRTKWFETHPLEETKRHLATLAQAIAGGHPKLPVEAAYDLADFAEAIARSRRPGTSGKVLLVG